MKKSLCLIFVISLLILIGCSNNETVEYPEINQFPIQEGYYENPPNYGAYNDGTYHMTLNPYDEYELLVNNNELNQYDKVSLYHYSRYFNDDTYTIYTMDQIDAQARFYLDIPIIDGIHRARFMQYNPEWGVVAGSFDKPWVEVIESNGKYSYAINFKYHSFLTPIYLYQIDLLNVLYNDETFPFTIYFDEKIIYLINNDSEFNKDYLFEFARNPQMFLFKPITQ